MAVNKLRVFFILLIFQVHGKIVQTEMCASRCQNSNGHVQNCSLNRQSHFLGEKQAFSQLQCFDFCLRQPGCQMYNFRQQMKSCQVFRGLWSFEDEKNFLVANNGTVFSWIGRDIYRQYLSENCGQTDVCQVLDAARKGKCKKHLDIAFLIDISKHNVGELNMTKSFIAKVLQEFDLSSGMTKVGMVEYSTNASVTFTFNNFTSMGHFQSYLTKIQVVSGKTRYDKSLEQAESNLFTEKGGARPFVHRAVVLIADNDLAVNVEDSISLPKLKAALKKKCIQTFAVGISGNGIKVAERVADSEERHLLKVNLHKQLESNGENFAKKICTALT